MQYNVLIVFLVSLIVLNGCYRGRPSEDPPIHVNPNMDWQPKYEPQEESAFFEDGSAMRMPVPGTIARGELRENSTYYRGKNEQGEYVDEIPVPVTMNLLQRGRERYDIYCATCHSRVGDGNGIVVQRGYPPAPSFHQDYIREYPDGQIYDVISNGIRNMPGYKHQIPVNDRWAIVSYFRALQRSQYAEKNDVPVEKLDNIK
ncbi:MAG: cytochrome c [Caldithrix sp.]|nr:cytochrome c [Caldithrix sp.]